MSESVEERLATQSNAFDGLLSLIPAKYYYDEESKEQWSKKKLSKFEKKKRKREKLESDSHLSALDVKQKREKLAAEQAPVPQNAEEDFHENNSNENDEFTIAFDDTGTAIGVDPSHEEEKEEDSSESKANEMKNSQKDKKPKEKTPKQQKKSVEHQNSEQKPSKPISVLPGIQELRDKLAQKVKDLREKRKAPGTGVSGAPVSREAILAARQQKKTKRHDVKSKEKKQENSNENLKEEQENSNEDISDTEMAENNDVLYGTVQFKDGQKTTGDLKDIEEEKKMKKRDLRGQLRHIEAKKARIASLDPEKRAHVESNAQWSRAILQAEGGKVRDNEKMLKKSLKQQEKRKKKSEKEWNERKATVAKNIANKVAKRDHNLAMRKEMKGVKGKANRDRLKKKLRAGFEGKRR